VNKKVKKI